MPFSLIVLDVRKTQMTAKHPSDIGMLADGLHMDDKIKFMEGSGVSSLSTGLDRAADKATKNCCPQP